MLGKTYTTTRQFTNMAVKKRGYIEKFLKKADKAIDEGLKKADKAIDEAVAVGEIASKEAKKKSRELKKYAEKEGSKIKAGGIKKISEGVTTARRMTTTAVEELELLERLAKMQKEGIITNKEFLEKKKKILDRI